MLIRHWRERGWGQHGHYLNRCREGTLNTQAVVSSPPQRLQLNSQQGKTSAAVLEGDIAAILNNAFAGIALACSGLHTSSGSSLIFVFQPAVLTNPHLCIFCISLTS